MYIDETALCATLGISRETARKYRIECGLPHSTLPGGQIRYEPEKVQAWLHSSIDLDSGAMKFGRKTATPKVVECAFAMAADLDVAIEQYDPVTLQRAEDSYGIQGLSLRELIHCFALRSGYDDDVSTRDLRAQLETIRASSNGPSTMSLDGILGNVANRFVRSGWFGVDRAAADAISAKRSTTDFKLSPSYRLSADLTYRLVPPGGEIESGTVGEVAAENQLETYGRLIHVPRTYIQNDDLSFFDVMLRKGLGRGAGLAYLQAFWRVFLSDPAFWSGANLVTGAASALDIGSLSQAVQKLEEQVDELGNPASITADILLTSSSNKVLGQRLVGDPELIMSGSTDSTQTSRNPMAGKLKHFSSSYLSAKTIPNADPDAWWILTDPSAVATIETLYLRNQESPTIASAVFDFSTLGISYRGIHDFACALVESKGSIKATGK